MFASFQSSVVIRGTLNLGLRRGPSPNCGGLVIGPDACTGSGANAHFQYDAGNSYAYTSQSYTETYINGTFHHSAVYTEPIDRQGWGIQYAYAGATTFIQGLDATATNAVNSIQWGNILIEFPNPNAFAVYPPQYGPDASVYGNNYANSDGGQDINLYTTPNPAGMGFVVYPGTFGSNTAVGKCVSACIRYLAVATAVIFAASAAKDAACAEPGVGPVACGTVSGMIDTAAAGCIGGFYEAMKDACNF